MNTHFLQNSLNSSSHRFNKVLETQLLQIFTWLHIHILSLPFPASLRCFIGLRSGNYGDHWSTVMSLSCSTHQNIAARLTKE